MGEFKRTGFTSITVGGKHYWFPTLPTEGDKVKVLLPVKGNQFTLIESVDDLVNWFFKTFPDAVMEAREIKNTESKPAEIKCPKCGCKDLTKNGFNLKGEQRYMCKHCFKTFIPKQSNSQEYSPLNT